jgi:hypothetical protein
VKVSWSRKHYAYAYFVTSQWRQTVLRVLDLPTYAVRCPHVTHNAIDSLQGDQKVGINITGWSKSWYDSYRALKKLVWILQGDQKVGMKILQGDQKVGMNITGWSKSWYEYYSVIKKLICILRGVKKVGINITGRPKVGMNNRVIKKLICILRGDQKVGMTITGWSKVGMNITGWSKSWYVYYGLIKKLVWIIQGDQKSWYEYYRVIKKLVWILQGDQEVGMNITGWSKMNKKVRS